MNKLCAVLIVLSSMTYSLKAHSGDKVTELISQKKWAHGAADCDLKQQPAIDILQLDDSSFILRQNKCLHYEAPFIYLFMGQHTAFLQDTGATAISDKFPLYDTVLALMTKWQQSQNIDHLTLIVTHSHGHSDHKAADTQFLNKPNVIVVEPKLSAVRTYFGFTQWPNGTKSIDLGNRELTFLPLPGHKDDAIAVYDSQTKVMLTGDSFYPGRLYIKNGSEFKASIKRLFTFAKRHNVETFLGTHIEMTSKAGKDYPIGSTYQPNESSLLLTLQDLTTLNQALNSQVGQLEKQVLNKVIIYPVK